MDLIKNIYPFANPKEISDGINKELTNRIQCNDIITTWKLFGIEAARKAIIRELRNVADGLKKVQVSILVDDGVSLHQLIVMMYIFSIRVPGLYNETDDMKSVSIKSMTGQYMVLVFQVIMNNNIIKKVDTIEEFNLNI